MNIKVLKKIKGVFLASIPSLSEISFLLKFLVVIFIGITFVTIFNYTSTSHAQSTSGSSNLTSVMPAVARWSQTEANGCTSFLLSNSTSGSSLAASSGLDSVLASCAPQVDAFNKANNSGNTNGQGSNSINTAFLPLDMGATGRLINATSNTYNANVATPGTTVEYYASQISGRAFAADSPTSGRSTLAPVFQLNQVMVNLSYALVVIVLIVSSLSILVGSLAGGEEKFTLVQLMINAGITLIVITFYYEIAAVIFDLCVNYGNALVASVLSPYINSYAILERLGPGGDLGIVATLNTFQFAGVTDSLLVVTKNIAAGVYPALAQTSAAYQRALGLEGLINQNNNGVLNWIYSNVISWGSSQSTLGISAVLTSFLGSSEVIASIVAWTLFIINLRVFINLLSAFLSFSVTVGFGPLIVLGAISGGFEKVTESFKNLAAMALVFPLTFLFILLGAISMNIYIRRGTTQGTGDAQRQVLCTYSPSDPQNTEASVIEGGLESRGLNLLVPYDQSFLSPSDTRAENYLNQNIFDTTPASKINGVRDCRSALFPVPWTYIPAPFGSLGIRTLQVQTIDSLVRTFMGIIFLIMAARAPKILEEVLGVPKMGFLDGIANSFKSGAQSFFGLGAVSLSIALPLAKLEGGLLGKGLSKIPVPRGLHDWASRVQYNRTFKKAFKNAPDGTVVPNEPRKNVGDVFGKLTSYDAGGLATVFGKESYDKMKGTLSGIGLPDEQASLLAGQNLLNNFDKITKQLTATGTALQAFGQGLNQVTEMLTKMGGQIEKFILTDIAA